MSLDQTAPEMLAKDIRKEIGHEPDYTPLDSGGAAAAAKSILRMIHERQ